MKTPETWLKAIQIVKTCHKLSHVRYHHLSNVLVPSFKIKIKITIKIIFILSEITMFLSLFITGIIVIFLVVSVVMK